MTTAKTATAQIFVKTPQFIEETDQGTTPTNPTLTSCGPVKSLSIMKDGKWVDVSQIGSEDLISIIEGLTEYSIKMKLLLLDGSFIAYGVNAADFATPTGTISAPLSILFSIYLNGVENFIIAKGSRCKTFAITMERGKADDVDMEFDCVGITLPSDTGPSGATYADTPSGTTLGHLDGGLTPVSIGGSGVLAQKVTVNINRNTTPEHILGDTDPLSNASHGRRITGTIDILWTNVTQETSFATPTSGDIVITLDTGAVVLTVPSAVLKTYKRDADADDTDSIAENIGFAGISAVLSA